MRIIRYKKKAFTLAEVMVVLLILTILFAALAPMFTKKRRAEKNTDFWAWENPRSLSGPMNAVKTNPQGSVFFGVAPMDSDDADNLASNSKVIIRSGLIADNRIQRQLQFRYGRGADNPYGSLAGTMLADTTNLLLGGAFQGLERYTNASQYPKNNFAFGYNALENISIVDNPIMNNVAIGYEALRTIRRSSNNNVAVGAEAGRNLTRGSDNVFLGAYADAGEDTPISNNTLIGYGIKSKGDYTVVIGSRSTDEDNPSAVIPANNTAIGYDALRNLGANDNGANENGDGGYNIALGYQTLLNLRQGSNNVAIGYNACSNLRFSSNKTCIGPESGPRTDIPSVNHVDVIGSEDNIDRSIRTYIGSFPDNVRIYDAPLEIHNMEGSTSNFLANNPNVKSNTTTVVNGNLVVKGRLFLTYGNYLYPFTFSSTGIFGVSEADLLSPCNSDQRSYNFGSCGINLSSDRRLKYIGSRFNGGLDEINKLQVYNYTYKKDPKKEPHTGVIAQQLQKVFPSAVSKGEDGYLRIRWDEMFYACINAIKTLNQRISSLVKRTLTLENEVNKLEKENSQLKAEVENISARVEKLKSLRK